MGTRGPGQCCSVDGKPTMNYTRLSPTRWGHPVPLLPADPGPSLSQGKLLATCRPVHPGSEKQSLAHSPSVSP